MDDDNNAPLQAGLSFRVIRARRRVARLRHKAQSYNGRFRGKDHYTYTWLGLSVRQLSHLRRWCSPCWELCDCNVLTATIALVAIFIPECIANRISAFGRSGHWR